MDISYNNTSQENFEFPLQDLESALKSSNKNILELKDCLKRVLSREDKLMQDYQILQQRFQFMRSFYTNRQHNSYAYFYQNTQQLYTDNQKLTQDIGSDSESKKQLEHTVTVLRERLQLEEHRVKTLEDEISQYNNTLLKAKDTLNYLRTEKMKLDEKMQNRLEYKDDEITSLTERVEYLQSQLQDRDKNLLNTERELQYNREKSIKSEITKEELKRIQERVTIFEVENIEYIKENKILKDKLLTLREDSNRELTASALSQRNSGRYTPERSHNNQTAELLRLKEENNELQNRILELEDVRETYFEKEQRQEKQIKKLALMLEKMNRNHEEAMYRIEQYEIQLKTYQHSSRRQETYYDKEQNDLKHSYKSQLIYYEEKLTSLQDAVSKLRSENISLSRDKETYLTKYRISQRELSEWKHGLYNLLIELLDLDSSVISDIETILEIQDTITLSPEIKQSISQVKSLIESSKILSTLDRFKTPLSPDTRRFMNTMRSSESFLESPIVSPHFTGGEFLP